MSLIELGVLIRFRRRYREGDRGREAQASTSFKGDGDNHQRRVFLSVLCPVV